VAQPSVESSPSDIRGSFSVTDKDGYTYDQAFRASSGPATSDGAQSPLHLSLLPQDPDGRFDPHRYYAEQVELLGGSISASEEFPLHGGTAAVYCQDGVGDNTVCFGLWWDDNLRVQAGIGSSPVRGDAQVQLDWLAGNLPAALTDLADYEA
jgi:hypothetical protein